MRADPGALAARAARFAATRTAGGEPESAQQRSSRMAHAGGKITTNKSDALRQFYVRMLRKGQTPPEEQRKALLAVGLDPVGLEAEVKAEMACSASATSRSSGDKEAAKEALRRQLEAAAAKRAQALEALEARAAGRESPAAKKRRLDSELDCLGGDV